MTSHFSIPSFFRKTPNALLKRYFAGLDLFGDLDFDGMSEARPTPLARAWDSLPDEVRRRIEPQAREIFDLSNEKGFRAISDEADWQLAGDSEALARLREKLASLPGHADRAMVTFLDHRELWRNAVRFCHADTLPRWRKRRGLPAKAAAIDLPSRIALAEEIGAWFRQAEGRGRNCLVELLRRDQRDYFFAFPEDFANERIEWVGRDLASRPHNPAFEVVFVWSAGEGTLDVNYRGGRKAIESLQAIFARNVLKLEKLPPAGKDERVYDLNPLKRRKFQFVRSADSGIESVRVRELRLSSMVRMGDRITLEAETAENPLALYDLIDQTCRAFPLGQWNVTQAEIVAQFAAQDDKPARRKTFTVGWPNSCSLKYDEVGLTLRAMLVASKIEPQ